MKWHTFALPILWSCFFALLLNPGGAQGQAVYGSISGMVQDVSGEPVTEAMLTIVSIEKRTTIKGRTNSAGFYTATHLLPDTYDVRIEVPGREPLEIRDVSVAADQECRADARLGSSLAQPQSTAASLLKKDRAEISTTFSQQEVHDLPLFNLDFTRLEMLTPGALRTSLIFSDPRENLQDSTQQNVNGQHFSGTSFQLDGADIPLTTQGTIVISPTLESIKEVKVTTQNFGMEFGQATAGVVTVQTRSGSNNWHGSLFGFRRTGWGQASLPRLPNLPGSSQSFNLIPAKRNEFGGSLGGPIIKNKIFLFADYQGTRRSLPGSQTLTVPTDVVRNTCLKGFNCDLSEYDPVVDPETGAPFAGNIIPASRVSAQAVKLASLLPPPNFGQPHSLSNNFTAAKSETFDDDAFNVRIDDNFNNKLKGFVRYSFADFRDRAEAAFGQGGGPGLSPDGFAGKALTRDNSLAAGFDYTLSSKLVTDFRFGFFQYHANILPLDFGTAPATDAGIPGLNLGDELSSGLPQFMIFSSPPSFAFSGINFGNGPGVNQCTCPLLESQRQFQWTDNFTLNVGNHLVRWGADIRYLQAQRLSNATLIQDVFPGDFFASGSRAILTFSDLGNFFLGNVAEFGFARNVRTGELAGSGFDPSPGQRQKRWFFYGQDTYRVTPKLTLNYGLRWEIYFPQSVTAKGGGAWLDLGTGMVSIAGFGNTNLEGNIRASQHNFAPLLGISYSVNAKTVIRSGFRRTFGAGFRGLIFGDPPALNPPLVLQQPLPFGDPITFNLSQGPPSPPIPQVPPSGQFLLPDNVPANAFPSRMRLPTVDAWNLAFQRELGHHVVFELSYVGDKGTHGFLSNSPSYDVNAGVPVLSPDITDESGAPLLHLEPLFIRKFGWSQYINYYGPNASNNYNAMQVKLEGRLKRQLFVAHYTWSKGMDHGPAGYNYDPKIDYGPNDFDRTHVFTLSSLIAFPTITANIYSSNARKTLNRILSGWNLSSVVIASSGIPFSPYMLGCANVTCRPDRVGAIHITGNRDGYFTGAVGETNLNEPGQQLGPWGYPASVADTGAGRNSLRGPGFFQADASLAKIAKISERISVQFRTDVYNLFNKVNLATPGPFFSATSAAPVFGGSNAALVDCFDQCGTKIYFLAPGALQRQIEFALRLQF